jgi:hypothetical protein
MMIVSVILPIQEVELEGLRFKVSSGKKLSDPISRNKPGMVVMYICNSSFKRLR